MNLNWKLRVGGLIELGRTLHSPDQEVNLNAPTPTVLKQMLWPTLGFLSRSEIVHWGNDARSHGRGFRREAGQSVCKHGSAMDLEAWPYWDTWENTEHALDCPQKVRKPSAHLRPGCLPGFLHMNEETLRRRRAF